jgi:hypothetical protein
VVRNHRIAPLADGVRGSFYPVFRPHELSAAAGYTTQTAQTARDIEQSGVYASGSIGSRLTPREHCYGAPETPAKQTPIQRARYDVLHLRQAYVTIGERAFLTVLTLEEYGCVCVFTGRATVDTDAFRWHRTHDY